MKNRLISSLVLLVAMLGTIGAFAQSDSQSSDAPGVDVAPGVARMSLINGDVSTQRGDSGEWAAAVLNAPIVSGDKVSTGDNARAEVQLDFANVLRLGDHTQATIANLTRNQIQVQIGEGIANYDVFPGSEAAAEVDTPNVAIHPKGDSSFRIIVNSGDETQIVVRRGELELSTAQGSTQARPGQMITVHGSGEETAYKTDDAPPNDDWDSWISERDSKIQNAKSWGKTDRYYTGSEDLDAYGQWKTAPDYGPVWVPAVSPDWAPYRDGRWVWEPYYGWTWVPNEPWGWAPYHYGRWFYYNSAWAWWPGPVVAAPYYRPIWAPAYVSFFGFGGGGFGVSVGFGFGSFGWLPLGPGDYCHPWWGGYRNRFNVVNVTNINNFHGREFGGFGPLREHGFSNVRMAGTNEHIMRAVSTVPAGGFGTGRIGARAVDPGVFREGRMMTGNLPVVPSRESLSASNRPANASTIRSGGQGRFFSNARPASVQPFERQATQLQQSIQRDSHFTPVRSGEQLSARNESPASIRPTERDIQPGSAGSLAKPSAGIRSETNSNPQPRNTNNGFTRFGSPQAQDHGQGPQQNGAENGRNPNSGSFHNNVPRPPQSNQGQNNSSQGSRPAGSDQSGWHRFSESGPAGGSNRPNTPNTSSPHNNIARPPSSVNRSYSAPRPPEFNSRGGSGNNSGDYRPFSSSPRNSAPQPSNRGYSPSDAGRAPSRTAAPNPGNGYPGGGYRAPSSSPGYSTSARSYSRPPLDMRQPIVGGRSSGGFPSGGGYRGGNPSFHSSGGGSSHSGGGGGGSSHSGGGGHHR